MTETDELELIHRLIDRIGDLSKAIENLVNILNDMPLQKEVNTEL